MKKAFIIYSYFNDFGIAFKVDEKDYEKAKELAYEGFDRWHDPIKYPEYHDIGYAEPSEELLKEAGIKYEYIKLDDWMGDKFYEDQPEWCTDLMWY